MARGKFKFRTANLLFLMVGHTHEDIDQFFSGLVTDSIQAHLEAKLMH